MFALIGIIALAAACYLAFKFGGFDEKLAATAFVVATLASRLVQQNYAHTETGVLVVDFLLLAGLLVLALKSDRFWPMYAAAFQFVGSLVHVASMTEQGSYAWAYAVGLVFWSYPVMIALMVGTWLEARSRQQHML